MRTSVPWRPHACPRLLSQASMRRQQQIELCELAVEAVKALGFQAGALHVELKYTTTNGPQLIEVNRW